MVRVQARQDGVDVQTVMPDGVANQVMVWKSSGDAAVLARVARQP